MKRLLLIAILITYSISSFGVSINYFYCCGKLKSVSLTPDIKEEKCKARSGKGCCKNETVVIKLTTDQKNTDQTSFQLAPAVLAVILHPTDNIVINFTGAGNTDLFYKCPPPDLLPSRRILYCIFRI
ncbi:hypothetical protein LK994_08435 [Ferruginibacter lapsinanis]|uniref:HYC_CC_PP family protein n=1 Tax=Ferruginibacter lapsinanis TaxID=563172 RepID=UPI001E30A2B8|nr:hypothetical protein [Ferruginibacter lapsinanis]UEG48662.1 hypothetical protein LK994_08435 [Ferruginibacter lapsinanis]